MRVCVAGSMCALQQGVGVSVRVGLSCLTPLDLASANVRVPGFFTMLCKVSANIS